MIHRIKVLYDEGGGLSVRAISRELGVSRNTVRKHLAQSAAEIVFDRADPRRSRRLDEHRHSRINYVTPQQRHGGEDRPILANRQALYEQAKAQRPRRWTGKTRDWTPIGSVWLNPDRSDEKAAEVEAA